MMDRNKKPLRLTDAEVEVEFVVNTNGTMWGDSKSPRYMQMLANRKAAKERAALPVSNPDHAKQK